MNNELQKRIEDVLEHLASNMSDTFSIRKLYDGVKLYDFKFKINAEELYSYNIYNGEFDVSLSLESIREIGQKIGYEVWAEPKFRGSDEYGDKELVWYPCRMTNDRFMRKSCYVDDYETFYEAMLEALLSAIWDKFPKKEGATMNANEKAIQVLQYRISELREQKYENGSKLKPIHDEIIQQLESAIELLKNPPMWNDEDMHVCWEEAIGEIVDFGTWIEDYRKQKLTTKSK